MSKSDDLGVYENTISILSDFLKNGLGVTTIEVHQIYFLLMYFPFYMVCRDLQDKHGFSVNFTNEEDKTNKTLYENDDAIIKKMLESSFNSLYEENGKTNLQLSLCEPVLFNERAQNITEFKQYYSNKGKIDGLSLQSTATTANKNYFIHLPFINFPPMYGISLVNNPDINHIKRDRMANEYKKIKLRNDDRNQVISLMAYWRHFSSKLSLLQKSDFEKLTASLYPKGSTTDWLIREDLKFKFHGKSWIKLEQEFEDLFHKHVDVAFTVQPWMAVVASEKHTPPLDVEIVYKNRCIIDYDCTSMIFKTNKKENLIIGDFILRCLYRLVHIRIRELYDSEEDEVKDQIEAYCNLRSKYCKVGEPSCGCECCECKNKDSNGEKKHYEGCLFENKVALQILNDSQIYQHRDKGIADIMNDDSDQTAGLYFAEKFGQSRDGLNKFSSFIEGTDGTNPD